LHLAPSELTFGDFAPKALFEANEVRLQMELAVSAFELYMIMLLSHGLTANFVPSICLLAIS